MVKLALIAQAAALLELVRAWGMLGKQVSGAEEAIVQVAAAVSEKKAVDAVLIALDNATVVGARLARTLRDRGHQTTNPHVVLVVPPEQLAKTTMDADGFRIISRPVRSAHLFDALHQIPETDDGHTRRLRFLALDALVRPAGAGERILVVDDAAINQLIARRALERLGYVVTVADSGRAALDRLSGSAYAVVLMDCRMPEMDGLEATRRIRLFETANRQGRTPVIALTANSEEGDREGCLATGMDDYLRKPLDLEQLSDKLRQWIGGVDIVPATVTIATSPRSISLLEPAALAMIRELQAPGETDLLIEMVDAFLASAPGHLEQMVEAVSRGEGDKVADSAHALKSGAAYLGAGEVQQLCLELETRGRAGVTAGSELLLAALHKAVEQAQVALVAESRRQEVAA